MQRHLWLMFFAVLNVAAVQQLCTDGSAPQANTLSFCTEYSGNTCCSVERDTRIGQLANSVALFAPADCAAYLIKMFCGECDPYAEWLFNKQTAAPASLASWLCEDYSIGFYNACAAVQLDWSVWPNGLSPFGGANPINSGYSVVQLFNKIYATPRGYAVPGGCYNGSATHPPPDPVAANDKMGMCVEYMGANSLSPTTMIVSLVDPNDGTDRLFVEYKRGDIEVWTRSTGAVVGNLLSIPNVYNTDAEAGLTSLVVHPKFAQNGRLFVHFSTQDFTYVPCTPTTDNCGTGLGCTADGYCKGDHVSVIAEYNVPLGSNVADPNSTKVLLALTQPFPIHNHGQLLFGPDGYMYLFWGDGGSSYDPLRRSQNHTTWLGKVLRIDVDSPADAGLGYHIPDDNPFFNDPTWSGRREVWAWGMRNPWRCSFEQNGQQRLICGDVGQEMREELDIILKGNDYGWSELEGSHAAPPANQNQNSATLTPPVLEYDHIGLMGGSPAVIGGYIYTSADEQCAAQQYIFADWQGIPLQFNLSSNLWYKRRFYVKGNNEFYPGIGRIFSLGLDSHGTMYYLASRGVYRLVPRAQCGLPSICASTDELAVVSFYANDPFGVQRLQTTTIATTTTPVSSSAISTFSATSTTSSTVTVTSSISSSSGIITTSVATFMHSTLSTAAAAGTLQNSATTTDLAASSLLVMWLCNVLL